MVTELNRKVGIAMTSDSVPERNDFLTPALFVSIAIAIFAVVTQLLEAGGVISLSSTQQLTMWLVALGLIVLLTIAYMASSASIARKSSEETHRAPMEPPTTGRQEAHTRPAVTGRQEAHNGKVDIEQAHAAVREAEARLDEARATNDAAEQGAKDARAQAIEAERDAVRLEARAEQAAKQLRAAVEEAEARLAEWEAVEVADWHKTTTERQEAHNGKVDIEQARAAVREAEARLDEARATNDAAEQGAKDARAQAIEAERDAVRLEARAEQAAKQLRAAVEEAEARLAEWEAVEVAGWRKAG